MVAQVDSLAMASSRQGRAHSGMSSRVWAWTAAARARATRAYFMVTVLCVCMGLCVGERGKQANEC